LTVTDPNIEDQNPELYAQYLKNLRDYKNSHHKIVYAWFDNSRKDPFSRGQHIENLPDSTDVVAFMYPDNLEEWELDEMNSVRRNKGMKIIFTLGYDAIKLNYDNMIVASQNSESEIAGPKDFISYLADTLQHTLKLVDKYNYDGISIGYNGKSFLHMTPKEKVEYVSNETAYIGIITSWIAAHKDKTVVFEGMPQNLVDKTILNSCEHIIIPTANATNSSLLTYNIAIAAVEGVPSDRFVITAETASLNTGDTKTGYWTDGSRAIMSSAIWVSATYSGFTIAGLGINNVNNDYYNAMRVYEYTKKAIDILNPSLKSN
jgi:hypothetical protein